MTYVDMPLDYNKSIFFFKYSVMIGQDMSYD